MANSLLKDIEYVLVNSDYGRGAIRITVVQRSAVASTGREYWTYDIQGHVVSAHKATSAEAVDAAIERLKS